MQRKGSSKQNGTHTEVSTGFSKTQVNPDKKQTKLVDDILGPLFLMATTPISVLFFFRTCSQYNGSVIETIKGILSADNIFWALYKWPNETSIKIVGYFALLQLALLVLVPGRWWLGTITPAGLRPSYKLNGPVCYSLTLALFWLGGVSFKIFNPSVVYDNYLEVLTFMCWFSYIMCFVFYFKGLYFPSSKDAGSTGNFIRDFFWGTELHPSFFGYYIKQYFNCRFSMIGWIVVMWCFAYKQYELYGKVYDSMLVSVALQTIYIFKFFLWEHGYFNSIDIMHDRFGYYIYWGVTVFVPGLYTIVPMYLVKQPVELGTNLALGIFLAGLTCCYLNYASDEQRLRFRETNGNTTFFGKKPQHIVAKYKTEDGVERESLLLVSGYWGFSRHFNYVAEISTAFCWSLPALFTHVIPYTYVIFLTLLLLHRLFRDEERCSLKYGKAYAEYKKRVPYFLIPYIF